MNAPTNGTNPPLGLDTSTTLSIIAAAADLSLVVDRHGNISDVRVSNDQLPLDNADAWRGKAWTSAVTSESRVKVEELLADAAAERPSRWRHINYPSRQGADVPILCSAIKAGEDGSIIAFGRDLRTMASLQQRLVEAHQAMERDYLRMRHMETRYRMLFELAAEAVLIIDTTGQRILEANPAASKILGLQTKKLIGRSLSECVPESHRTLIEDLLQSVRSSGEADVRTIPDAKDNLDIIVSASLFRQESGTLFLVRLTPSNLQESSAGLSPKRSVLIDVLERSPDAFVVTDNSGKILTCNHAFVEMAQLTKVEQVTGRNLSDWLGRSDVDLSVLIANIQQRGAVRLFATMLHGVNGADLQVEISGVSVKSSPTPCLGFSIRDVGQRLGTERPSLHQLPRSADQLVELVGRVPLQEIVSETADLIEKLCIEAALRLTRDNRASAAEMLGLSRQSLYVKLRRYGIGEVTDRSKK
jgi:transcriptional regulator PpsR